MCTHHLTIHILWVSFFLLHRWTTEPGQGQGPRVYGHSATRITHGCVLFYGGFPSGSTPSNAMYTLNTTQWLWNKIQMSGYLQNLLPRYCHTAVCLPGKNEAFSSQVIVYGGSNFNKYARGDLYTMRVKFSQGRNKQKLGIFDSLLAKAATEAAAAAVLNLPVTLIDSDEEIASDDESRSMRTSTSRLSKIERHQRGCNPKIRSTIHLLRR